MTEIDILNTAFCEDDDFVIHINDNTSYAKFSDVELNVLSKANFWHPSPKNNPSTTPL